MLPCEPCLKLLPSPKMLWGYFCRKSNWMATKSLPEIKIFQHSTAQQYLSYNCSKKQQVSWPGDGYSPAPCWAHTLIPHSLPWMHAEPWLKISYHSNMRKINSYPLPKADLLQTQGDGWWQPMVMPPHRNDSKRIGAWPSKISTRILWVQTLKCWLSLLAQANSSSIGASREHVFTSVFFPEIFLQRQDVLHTLVFQKSRVLRVWKSPISSLIHATIVTIYTSIVSENALTLQNIVTCSIYQQTKPTWRSYWKS